jgi:hypothetical protein
MTTYICKCGRRVKKSADASTTGNRLSGYAPGHECWGCPYAIPYGDFQWDESARTVVRETRGYECRMSKTLTYASEFAGSIKDKCTCRVHSLDFDFLSQVSAWIKDTYPDREIFGSFSKDIRASDYGSDGRYCLTITCTQNLKGVAAKRELFGQFFNPDGSRKGMTPQQEMEKVLADIRKATQAKEKLECTTMDSAAPSENAGTSFATGGAPLSNGTGSMTEPVHSAPQDKPLAFLPETTIPEFDYSGLPEQTVENLHFAEDEYHHGKQMAERGLVHMGNAIAAAHDALCGVVQQLDTGSDGACRNLRRAHNNQHCDDTFRAWCVSIGITKDTAYRLLQVAALMDNSSPRQQRVLKELSPSLLYAVAKPSAPAELVAQVKSGDITTHKQYQEALAQIKAEKDRANAAEAERDKLLGAQNRAAWAESHIQDVEAQRDAALADVQGLTEQNAKLQQSYHDADESRIAANLQRQKAEAERDRAEARAHKAEDALKHQPIAGVVDEEEVDRRAAEKAWGLADARNRELQEENDRLKKNSAQLERRMKAMTSRMDDLGQTDFETANHCPEAMLAIWNSCKGSYSRLTGEDLENTFQYICNTLNSIRQEAALLCRQPEGYDGGAA